MNHSQQPQEQGRKVGCADWAHIARFKPCHQHEAKHLSGSRIEGLAHTLSSFKPMGQLGLVQLTHKGFLDHNS